MSSRLLMRTVGMQIANCHLDFMRIQKNMPKSKQLWLKPKMTVSRVSYFWDKYLRLAKLINAAQNAGHKHHNRLYYIEIHNRYTENTIFILSRIVHSLCLLHDSAC